MVEIILIDGWKGDKPKQRRVNCSIADVGNPLSISLLEYYRSENGKPACGNVHAGTGRQRVVLPDAVEYIDERNTVDKVISANLDLVGERVLVSAGHYIPVRNAMHTVNKNSYKSLCDGLELIREMFATGKKADLLITINDVTVNSNDEKRDDLPTMNCDQRAAYYDNFFLPDLYLIELEKLKSDLQDFNIYVVGENKLSGRLDNESRRLYKSGLLSHPSEGNYGLPAFIKLNLILEIAHDSNEKEYEIFIANQGKVTGRPKCVRACTKLAALPHELGYTGFIQYLPVCSRNALEGFLIGNEIYGKKYGKMINFISVHNVYSCM